MSSLVKRGITRFKQLKRKLTRLPVFRAMFRKRLVRLTITVAYLAITSFIFLFQAVPASAATISQRGTLTTNGTGSGAATTLTLTKPTGVIAGDVLIAVVALGLTTGSSCTGANCTDWHQIDSSTSTNINLTTLYRVVQAGDSGITTWSFGWDGSSRHAAGAMMAFKGVDNTQVIDNTGAAHSTNTGSSAAPSANAVTTVTANTMLIVTYIDNIAANNIADLTSPWTHQYEIHTSNASAPNVSAESNTKPLAATGSTGAVATTSTNLNWVAQLVALKPAPSPTASMGAYRFLSNLDGSNPEFITSNPSGTDDTIRGLAVDTANGYFYIGGFSTTTWEMQKRRIDDGSLDATFTLSGAATGNIGGISLDPTGNYIYIAGNAGGTWRIEKRRTTDGALCTAANCGTAFDTDGIINSGTGFPAAGSLNSIDIDGTNGFIYVGGYESTTNDKWMIGKYSTSTGAVAAGFQQSAGTSCTSNPGYACNNPSANNNERIRTIAVDPQNGYVYAGGWYTATDIDWRMEKRRISDGALCSAANCGTQFATNGVYTEDPGATDQILTFQVDTPGNAIYVGGLDSTSGNEWRLEKLNATTGALCTAGVCGATAFDTDGIITVNTGAGDDELLDLDLDDAGGFLYTTGQDDVGGTNMRWRIEKRNRSDGSLVTSFGNEPVCTTAGVVCVDPSINDDAPAWISVDLSRNLLYTSGGDRTPGVSDQQWRIQKFDLDAGGIWLDTPQDTAAVASTNITFRLRLLIRVTTQQALAGDIQYKLQFATKVGTCDTSYTDESYNDVTGSTEIKYHDNSTIADGAAFFTPVPTGDPTDGSNPIVVQTVEEANNFTPANDTSPGSDMEFDYSLQDNNSFGVYCFKVVDSAGGAIAAPNVVPEISFCRDAPNTTALLHSGTYFCGGVKKPFFWAQ